MTALTGQKLGIKEVEHGILLMISIMRYDPSYIDLMQRTLEIVGNPFGTSL